MPVGAMIHRVAKGKMKRGQAKRCRELITDRTDAPAIASLNKYADELEASACRWEAVPVRLASGNELWRRILRAIRPGPR